MVKGDVMHTINDNHKQTGPRFFVVLGILLILMGLIVGTSLTGCTTILKTLGLDNVAESMEKQKETQDITFSPPEEYYIGRSVAAYILKEFTLYSNPMAEDPSKQREIGSTPLEKYVTRVGRTLVMGSDRPETFTGYRFLLIESPEINAFAIPNGYIFITTGIINKCETEDDLAGVLAHEINHIVEQHPTKSIADGIRKEAVADTMKSAAEDVVGGGGDVLKGLMDNVVDKAFSNSLQGYGKRQELEADVLAVRTLIRAGYDPYGLVRVLNRLEAGGGVHGDPADRVKDVTNTIETYKSLGVTIPPANPERDARFQAVKSTLTE
jgi:beta-barrel assembly-enhancing protease